MPVIPEQYVYRWPRKELSAQAAWSREATSADGGFPGFWVRSMPETAAELENDSRWPGFFPSPLCIVTTADHRQTALEKVVGVSIVNRFPYVAAVSFCRQSLSKRHHVRRSFMDVLERGGTVAMQFLPPGAALDLVMDTILSTNEGNSADRVKACRLPTRPARTSRCPVFSDAYMVYEARLVEPASDFSGISIYEKPWLDVGSHRVYFVEITAIQLRGDIALGKTQIHWRSLPSWRAVAADVSSSNGDSTALARLAYQKGFTADYAFPSGNTVAFEADESAHGMAVKHLPPLARDQVQVDNDRARWPCFFPSSVGMITTWTRDGVANLMPCGSTTLLSRQPLVICPAVSYAAINQRYAPRSTLDIIRETGRFGCGVPHLSDKVMSAIRYAGNVSLERDADKVRNSGLELSGTEWSPRFRDLPVHFDCQVAGEVRLGTHILFLGEVRRISVRGDVSPTNPLQWCPWARLNDVALEVRSA
jgi:flavin reductase (DIM6/NTAB) family NADH-FMN oxidoreductase RutF